ncbi:DsbA family protein [Cupriavidus oxalaticus]|uniref:DsbA family protein n=1 Tax=Cupriavidus oxalaticus TaxID=96344 RepID=UPI003181B038
MFNAFAMDTDMPAIQLQYLFDPLCGWCYASAPALAWLSSNYSDSLQLLPSGLFTDQGARDVTPAWAVHAWTNDQRIASTTGQVFSEKYHREILLGTNVRFDSGPMNRALTAVGNFNSNMEPRLLSRLQTARYVDGLDTSIFIVVATITADFLADEGVSIDAVQFSKRLEKDAELINQTNARVKSVQLLMKDIGVSGVPLLLIRSRGGIFAVRGDLLYGPQDHLARELTQLESKLATA